MGLGYLRPTDSGKPKCEAQVFRRYLIPILFRVVNPSGFRVNSISKRNTYLRSCGNKTILHSHRVIQTRWLVYGTYIYTVLTDHFSYSKLTVTRKMGDLRDHLSHIKNFCKEVENKLFSMLVKNQEIKSLFRSKEVLNLNTRESNYSSKNSTGISHLYNLHQWMLWRSVWGTW